MENRIAVFNPALKYLPPLPETVTTRGGAVFDPNDEDWSFKESTKTVSIPFTALKSVTPDLVQGLKLALIWFAENRSASHMENMFQRFLHFMRVIGKGSREPFDAVTDIHILNYKASLNELAEWYLRNVSVLIKKWYSLGYHGIEERAIAVLKGMRLKSNRKGEAVRTMDPYRGPFTAIELESIQTAITGAYAANEITTADYMLVWLFMLLGGRPVQYALLKVCDFCTAKTDDGGIEYCLAVPRAKQRHGKARLEFKERVITPQIGQMLEMYVKEVHAEFGGVLADPTSAPLFPARPSEESLDGYAYHATAHGLGGRLVSIFDNLIAHSERTGARIHITATRFRRTLGTRAAEEGHGELIIAELLDHSDTSNAGVYVEATPAIVERIDRAIALQMAPLAQAFAGVLIKSEAEATRAGDPASRIMDPRIDKSMKPMGSCGSFSFCGQLAPIACYTCNNFQPWLDGPHQAVLDHLIAERDRMLGSSDKRIASVNDRTILAVAEVVRRCEETRATMQGGGHG